MTRLAGLAALGVAVVVGMQSGEPSRGQARASLVTPAG